MLLRRTALACFLPLASIVAAAQSSHERFATNLGGSTRTAVEHRPGASGTVASDWLRHQQPDGHNLMRIEVSSQAAVCGASGASDIFVAAEATAHAKRPGVEAIRPTLNSVMRVA